MSSSQPIPSSPAAAPVNTKQPSTWNLSSVLNFQPSNICCGTLSKGDHCTRKLCPYTSNSIPGKTPKAMQEEILEQLVSTKFRSSAKTKEILHNLTGLSLCKEHWRQQDRLKTRWFKDIEGEKVREKEGEEQRNTQIATGPSDEDEMPESPTPLVRGHTRRPPTSKIKQTRKNFDRLASRGPRIPTPLLAKKSSTHSATAIHLDVLPAPIASLGRGGYLPTPRTTPNMSERRPVFRATRCEASVPSINALIDTGRKYSQNNSPNTSSANLEGMATKIPKPTALTTRNPDFSTGMYPEFGALPPTPRSLRLEGLGREEGVRGGLGTEGMAEVLMLQKAIFGNMEQILRDQGRIFEIFGGSTVV
ncbi:hypothetical protein EG328_004092 [Venturia inaequalis]|uniref:Uncharacterized protein n=1 Tax=Venturia inaequalis TaxID=5025 RepID=A0A8H3USI7_VENIN|nr:hypothetical protein EG328_004092 [Venturia inaequalis]KAE9989435.1 hypothetical protein EG327_002704 [Venturia inaequalis]